MIPSAQLVKSQEIAKVLCDQLGLEAKRIRRIVLTIDASELPTLTLECLISTDDAQRIKDYIEHFSLVPKNDRNA